MSVQRSLAIGLVAATALVGATAASAEIDKSASAVLASAVKPAMQTKLKKVVPGLVITKVTCYVPTTSALIAGKCTAKFTVKKHDLLGTYQTKATMNNQMRLTWSTTSVACTDAKSHAKVEC